MASESPQFSLVDDPWIDVRLTDGSPAVFTLRDVFERSTEVSKLRCELPTQEYTLLRLLLAIYWRSLVWSGKAHEIVSDPREWWNGAFSEASVTLKESAATLGYLSNFADAFELFHPEAPFMQVVDLEKGDGQHESVQRLLFDSESDYLSTRSGKTFESLSFREAALWLLHMQAWDYSGIKPAALGDPRGKGGKGYPIGTGWCGNTGGVMLSGKNLAETLILNTNPSSVFNAEKMDTDLPAWERGPGQASPRSSEFPVGAIDIMTWQSRRVRLYTNGNDVTGVLVTQGDKAALKNQFADPMTAYRYSQNQSSKLEDVHLPRQHDSSRTMWRGVSALLARETVSDDSNPKKPKQVATVDWLIGQDIEYKTNDAKNVGVELVGLAYGTQSAVITNNIYEKLSIPLAVLIASDNRFPGLILSSIDATLQAAVALGQFAGNVRRAAGADYEFQVDAMESVLHLVDGKFKSWLSNVSADLDHAAQRNAWMDQVEADILEYANMLIDSAGPKALIGRLLESENGKHRFNSVASAFSNLRRQLAEILKRAEVAEVGVQHAIH